MIPLVALTLLWLLSPTTTAFIASSTRTSNIKASPWLLQPPPRDLMMILRADTASETETEEATTATTTDGSTFPSTFNATSVYDQIGIREDQLALGIEAEEVLQYVGTRQALVDRFLKDLPKLDKTKVEAEVDKFLMDAEMLTSLITYEKAMANDKEGMFGSSQAQEDMSWRNPKVVATYAAWIAGGVGFSYVRRTYIDPKFASGEWEPIHLPNPMDLFHSSGDNAATEAITNAALTSMTSTNTHDVWIDAASSSVV
jgi:hypothetical protein